MFPVGVILVSVGYAVAYYGAAVLAWVHDPAHPHVGPPSLAFLLGASTTTGKPFKAPVNTEAASDPFAPFGAASAAASASAPGGGAASGPPGSGPSVLTPQGELGAIISGLGG